MRERKPSASASLVPADLNHETLEKAAKACKACPLWKRATQTVVGEGPVPARILLIGEQPGDQEDLAGHPFVGPAGKVLHSVLAAAELPRERIYLTNAVKHFKWVPQPRGKRRLHARPNMTEVNACLGWLEAEIALVKPGVIVCLGATAAQALFGSSFKVTAHRGESITGEKWAKEILVTYHPSAILRLRAVNADGARAAENELISALVLAKKLAAKKRSA